eukprot:7505243-Pyramimonas_sp.AAC.1
MMTKRPDPARRRRGRFRSARRACIRRLAPQGAEAAPHPTPIPAFCSHEPIVGGVVLVDAAALHHI